jgi:hypothetical protein
MDESSVVYLLNSFQHFNEKLNSNLETVVRLQVFTHLGQIVTEEIHNNKVLFAVLDEIIDVADVLESLKVCQDVVLEDQYALVLVLLLNLQGYVLFQLVVECLVDETECSLPKFVFKVESLRDLEGILGLGI